MRTFFKNYFITLIKFLIGILFVVSMFPFAFVVLLDIAIFFNLLFGSDNINLLSQSWKEIGWFNLYGVLYGVGLFTYNKAYGK